MKTLGSIAGYELKKLLGSTGPTETYQARGPRAGGTRAVAFKLLRLERLPAELRGAAAARFLEAGRRAAAAAVGGMARVIEVSQDPALPFVASELVPGIDLAYLVRLARKRNPTACGLEPSLAGALAAQVARILTSAHESTPPLHHLGLGPSSVRVTPMAGVMVVGFGLGASLRGVGEQRISGWYFLPPELLTVDASVGGDGSGEAADVYSLGALLYFLLAGKPPLEADSLTQLVERSWEPLPVLPGVPAELNRAMQTLMNPEPAKRLASAREAAEMLSVGTASPQERHQHIASALRGLGISERPPKTATSEKPAENRDAPPPADSPTASNPTKRKQRMVARAGRPGIGPWRSRALMTGGALAAFGIAAWAVTAYRESREQARREIGPAAIVPSPAEDPMGKGSSRDGGLLAGNAEMNPTIEVYSPEFKSLPSRVPNHLFLDTNPAQADVWVDGVLRGKTPVDLVVGPGSHRAVLIKAGYRILRAVFDTTEGEYARRTLQRAGAPTIGDAFLSVECPTEGKYPIVLDDEETGLLCPVSRLPVTSGKHSVGIFVPIRKANVTVEVKAPPGRQLTRVLLKE